MNYKTAFSSFDYNSDKSVDFKEFMNGLEKLGVKFTL